VNWRSRDSAIFAISHGRLQTRSAFDNDDNATFSTSVHHIWMSHSLMCIICILLSYNRGGWYFNQCYIMNLAFLLVTQHRFFYKLMGTTARKRRGMSEIPHPHAAHLPYLPEPRQWLWLFCMSISGLIIFRGRWRFTLLYNIGDVLEKCYIVLHSGRWSKNTIFALICERPLAGFLLTLKSWKLLEFYFWSGIFGIISRFTLVFNIV